MSQKFAVFDIDGTLFRWQLFHELVFELSNQGRFSAEDSKKLNQAFAGWRGQNTTWDEYENEIISAIENNISNLTTTQLEAAAIAVLQKSGNNVHAYTASLAKKLKKDGYYLLAISGSQQEIAEIFAKKHGFDSCIGMVHARTPDGGYKGEYDRFVVDKKGQLLQEFVANNGLTFTGSYGIGDSTSDIPVLQLVDNPIAFNPNEKLLETAQANGWQIVIERKNIAYTLTKLDLSKTSSPTCAPSDSSKDVLSGGGVAVATPTAEKQVLEGGGVSVATGILRKSSKQGDAYGLAKTEAF